jgi:hypothetical protein
VDNETEGFDASKKNIRPAFMYQYSGSQQVANQWNMVMIIGL